MSQDRSGSVKHILMIEDDPVCGTVYSAALRADGFAVEVASDGQAGRDRLTQGDVDLVVLDLMLPKITGLELLKYARTQEGLKKVPIVVFSNTYLTNLMQEAWKSGATRCLSKVDCSPTQLAQVVQKCLASAAKAPVPAPGRAAPPEPPESAALPHLQPGTVIPGPAPAEGDAGTRAEALAILLKTAPQTVATLRTLVQAVTRAEQEEVRLARLDELRQQLDLVSGKAGLAGLLQVARLTAAVEAFTRELHAKPRNANASTMRTLAQSVDFLGTLFDRSNLQFVADPLAAKVLVVDDELLSRRAVTQALERAGIKPVSVDDPMAGHELLERDRFDLVVLDVEMPGMDGFELCAKLRAMPAHARTPVVFVTSHSDFDSRAKSIMSGANDFISKPFMFLELSVKALTHLLRTHLARKREETAQAGAPAAAGAPLAAAPAPVPVPAPPPAPAAPAAGPPPAAAPKTSPGRRAAGPRTPFGL